jgi:hypothetical protein
MLILFVVKTGMNSKVVKYCASYKITPNCQIIHKVGTKRHMSSEKTNENLST